MTQSGLGAGPSERTQTGTRTRQSISSTLDTSQVFVHGLYRDMPNHVVKKLFAKFGEVTDAFNTGKGYGFVSYKTEDQARMVRLKN